MTSLERIPTTDGLYASRNTSQDGLVCGGRASIGRQLMAGRRSDLRTPHDTALQDLGRTESEAACDWSTRPVALGFLLTRRSHLVGASAPVATAQRNVLAQAEHSPFLRSLHCASGNLPSNDYTASWFAGQLRHP
ncbi:hypothetical protein [Planctomycetes bacterium SV_7m_r]